MRDFTDTSAIPVPEALIAQVLGQDEACAIIQQAARQRRHVLLIGDPGTGNSNSRYSPCSPSLHLNKTLFGRLTPPSGSNRVGIMPKMDVI